MADNIYTYGFDEDAIPIKSYCQQGMQKQTIVDSEQDLKIEQNIQNTYVNTTKIEENTAKNVDQDKAIDEINEKIKNISGGTITVSGVDAGTW